VVLAVPSRDGLDAARDKVRDLLAWEEVSKLLADREDIDTLTTTRLKQNQEQARAAVGSAVLLAYSVAVTVDEKNAVAAYRINVDNEPLFAKLIAEKKLRIQTTAVNAEALLPGGPYDLWGQGDTSRYVKDLIGAFAATASLPKMLNREAILETLLQGCEAGDFVLRVTRADKSTRSFWRARPDETATADPTLELVLPDAALLTEIDPAILAPNVLPGLWDAGDVTCPALTDYFSGKHLVTMDMGGWTESRVVPAAVEEALKEAVADAVKRGLVWLVNGTTSLLREDVPLGFVNERAVLLPPPATVSAADLLPDKLPAAWSGDTATGEHMRSALSADLGRPLPWVIVQKALDQAFQLGVLERTLDSGAWPCDLGGAASVRVRRRFGVSEPLSPPLPPSDGKTGTAVLEPHELQDLADVIDQLIAAAAGHELILRVAVELHREGGASAEAVAGVNAVLEKVKEGWGLQ
jgi:hypothetical protein